ncbi:hypothetical protein AB0D57_10800 [Streptomyces sp. NPDC048275]|uniref:hypothetical protein n=1 Tax=Streptomyces sp. NPDC048275 TaxID=3155629 RepID=UPI0033FFDFA6
MFRTPRHRARLALAAAITVAAAAPSPGAAGLGDPIFPSNDHPSQRAPIAFRITTPPGLTAAADGELTHQWLGDSVT